MLTILHNASILYTSTQPTQRGLKYEQLSLFGMHHNVLLMLPSGKFLSTQRCLPFQQLSLTAKKNPLLRMGDATVHNRKILTAIGQTVTVNTNYKSLIPQKTTSYDRVHNSQQ